VADKGTKPKRKAKDNPWYRLATLHGEPSKSDDEIAEKNRVTWNRWMASRIPDEIKTALREKGWSDEELTPFAEDELRCVEAQVGSPLEADRIDFQDTEFESTFFVAGFVFPLDANFAEATFVDRADFTEATFGGRADFSSATFLRSDAGFSSYANFARATFVEWADFTKATFGGIANFASATFSSDADVNIYAVFASATFVEWADFAKATFRGETDFTGATFVDTADFTGATFVDTANFGCATFGGEADFGSATFSNYATFGATFSEGVSFVNAALKSVTLFCSARFRDPPFLFGAELHEGTIWRDVSLPAPPKDKEKAGEYVEAYERLKLEMDRLKKHGDELDFFARELQCRRVIDGRWTKGLPIWIYGVLSNYGRSYARPFGILIAIVLLGAIPIRAHFSGWSPVTFIAHGLSGRALGLSFANTFSVLSIRKDFIGPDLLQSLPGWLKVVATIQTILGIVLLFLFGLGIRNRFRMK
jgi:uncharacterized protein YjbI with pentapeptide repeats